MMDIYITDLTTSETIQIPKMPEKVKVSYTNDFLSYNILRLGEVKFPNGVGLSTIEWDCDFPGEKRKNDPYIRAWRDPKELHNWLERVKIDGRKVRIMVTETPINFDCYIDSFNAEFSGGYGDLTYSLKWVQAKDIDVTTEVNYDLWVAPPPRPVPPPPPPVQKRTYTVVPGDCLWYIADEQLGDPYRWPEIYEMNRDVIGGNPDLIYPGQVYTLP